MDTTKKLLDTITLEVQRPEQLGQVQLLDIGRKHGVVNVRGLIDPETIRAAKRRIEETLLVGNDCPATGEKPQDLYNNHQKFAVGGGELRDNAHPQCLRTYYNPVFAEDLFGMREPFRAAARLRNVLMGFELDFAIDRIEDGFWTAARIHHYPRGGGFMSRHREDYVPTIYEQFGLSGEAYFQPLIVMSKKGSGSPDHDFVFGGGYFERDGIRHYYEEHAELGDILVYDTRTMHGVTEIDPTRPFRQDSAEGRYSGFVTLYRDFSADDH
ncbi:MAG: hypothetical protein HKN06_03615 [Gammaproteobacteria bacterium]|nr:hypothetical protein [Gammaproteobacteria bacterium]